jgi:hypothetical protein
LIPVHPPHYIYALLNKLEKHEIKIDIHLIFSNENDYHLFDHKDRIHEIICKSLNTNSIVTYKKFEGLKYLMNRPYEYIICCDSEIDIIPEHFTSENIEHKIHQIFNQKKIYSGKTNGQLVHKIQSDSANLFPEYDQLRTLTHDFSDYFWWSDLPVYRTSDLVPFFERIDYSAIEGCHFDYVIYQYYLMLVHGFQLVDTTCITSNHWSLECYYTTDRSILDKLLEVGYGFSWNSYIMYQTNKAYIEEQKGFILYHLDRPLGLV